MRRLLVVSLVVLFVATAFSGCLDYGTGDRYYAYPEEIEFVFTNTVELRVVQGEVDYTISAPFPVQMGSGDDAIQEVVEWSATSGGALADYYGSERVQWNGTADYTVTVSYRVTVVSRTVKWMESSGDAGYPGDIPASVKERYPADADEWLIRPTDPVISQVAANIVSPDMTVTEAAREILDYINERIEYETLDGGSPKDCTRTLADGTGDCDDQSILFCSIARAAGIPAWLEFGYLYDEENANLGPHGWVALYLPLRTGGGGKVNIDVANSEFMLRSSAHVTTWEDVGDARALRDYYNVTVYSGFPPFDVRVTTAQDLISADPSAGNVIVMIEEGERFIPLPFWVAPAVMALAAAVYSRRR